MTIGMKARAFTLIELLVVIAIVAVLAAVLFPVFAQAKASGKRAAAISNTKQLSTAMLLYIEDNNETFPGYVQGNWPNGSPPPDQPIWPGMIQPHVKNLNVFLDPAAPSTKFSGIWDRRGELSIGYNAHFGWWYDGFGDNVRVITIKMSKIVRPSTTVLLASTAAGPTQVRGNAGFRGYIAINWRSDLDSPHGRPIVINADDSASLSDRHQKGTVVGLADGSAKWYRTERLLPNRDRMSRDELELRCVVDYNPAGLRWGVAFDCVSADQPL